MTVSFGFVGCGRMGLTLLQRACRRGHRVAGVDPNPETENVLAEIGATYATSVAALAAMNPAAIVFCLPDARASGKCLAELLQAWRGTLRTLVLIQGSTLSPVDVDREVAAVNGSGIIYIDAPVSGGPQGGYLTSIAAADMAHFELARPILESYSDNVFHVGDQPRQGQIAKLVNNALSLGTLVLASEVIARGVGTGLRLSTLVDVINASSGRSAVTEQKFVKSIVPGTYDYGASMAVASKDMSTFCDYFGLRAGVVDMLARTWDEGKAEFGAEADFTSIYRLFEQEPVRADR